jgi:hypothetical protein
MSKDSADFADLADVFFQVAPGSSIYPLSDFREKRKIRKIRKIRIHHTFVFCPERSRPQAGEAEGQYP